MIYYINQSTDPTFNIALEEILASDQTINDDILLLWQNENSIIIGRNQNTIEEINNQFVKEHNVNVVRRMSGGGAVYHDLGNLNFTFIMNKQHDTVRNYQIFTAPIVQVLQKMGLDAQFSGKNDIEINSKKISGNAQFLIGNRIVHHGTILFNVDLTFLPQVLNPDLEKLQSKGIKSIQARVTNILPLLKNKISIEQFKTLIIDELKTTKQATIKELDQSLIDATNDLADKKYRTWEWNYGHSPAFNLHNKTRIENKGTLDVRLNVEQGLIKGIKIYGDFLGAIGTELIENKLLNQPYQLNKITELINQADINQVFGSSFTTEEIIHAIIRV